MSLTSRALWAIERTHPVSLAEVAAAVGVSRCHLAHAFGEAAGMTVMDYVRARRLTHAAEALGNGARDILQVALEAGYGSHEAFSRAFRARFAATPEAVRRRGSMKGLNLQPPLELAEPVLSRLARPRFVEAPPILAVGLNERRVFGGTGAIPDQWRRFAPFIGGIANRARPIPIGVLTPIGEDGAFEYACAVEVSDHFDVPAGLARLTVPAQRYVIFRHAAHASRLSATYRAILEGWLPEAGLTLADGPSLERHAATFDWRTGEGGVEVWLPMAG